jgi:O-antigen/teichoic acid export membrane protein
MSTKKTYLANVSAQGIGRVFSTAVSIIVYILIARILGPDIFGQYSYILVFWGLFVVVADFGTQVVFARDIAQIKESANIYWGNFLLLRIGLSLLMVVPSVIVAFYLRQDLFCYILTGCLFLPFLSSRFFEPLYQVYHRPWFSTYSSFIYGFMYLFFVCAALSFSRKLLPVTLAYIGSNVIYTVVLFFFAFKLLKPKFEIKEKVLKNILKLAAPIGVASLFTTINSYADIFMLANMTSDLEVGIYNAAYRFLDMAAMLAVILMNPIIPIFSKQAVDDRGLLKKNFMKFSELLAIITIPVAIVVPHISSMIITLLFGAAFSASAQVLNILAWVGVLVFYSLLSSAGNLSMGVVKHGYWCCALAALVNVSLNFLWIPKYSYIGSTWATLISEIILVGVSFYYLIKNVGNVFNFIKWAKIIAANLVLYFLLGSDFYKINLFLKIGGSLTIYLFLIGMSGLISKEDIYSVLTAKFQGFLSNSNSR